MLEKNFKSKIQKQLKAEGFVIIQNVASAGIPTGFPDTTIFSPTGKTYLVEWKKNKNARHQPLQDLWIAKLTKMGHNAQFVYPENSERWLSEIRAETISKRIP